MKNYTVGQKFKNSPTSESHRFELIKITNLNGTMYYRLKDIFTGEEFIEHEESMHPL
ncbi:hypothetical protein ACI3ER_12165 [Bacillus sp. Wb]